MPTVSELMSGNISNAQTNAKTWKDILFNVKDYKAKGDGKNDDTVPINNTIAAARKNGGGTVFFPQGTYRVTGSIALFSDITIQGSPGAEILADFKGTYVFHAEGSISSAMSFTANGNVDDQMVAVSSVVTGLAAGDLIQLSDNRNGAKYGNDILILESSTTTSLTFQSRLALSYLTTNSAAAKKISPVESIVVDGIKIRCSNTSDIQYLIRFQYGKNITVKNCLLSNHRHVSNPTAATDIEFHTVFQGIVDNNRSYGVNDNNLMDGNYINTNSCVQTLIADNSCVGGSFGIGCFFGVRDEIRGNNLTSNRGTAKRGIKLSGSYFCVAANNVVNHFISGFKIEESGRNIIMGNNIIMCGTGINVSNQYTGKTDYVLNRFEGNTIKFASEYGVFSDSLTEFNQFLNNTIDTPTLAGIHVEAGYNVISGNQVYEAKGDAAIEFHPRYTLVSNNKVYGTDNTKKSFRMMFNTNVETLSFLGNYADNNPIDTDLNFNAAGFVQGNYVAGLSNQGAYTIPLFSNLTSGETTSSTFVVIAYASFPGKLMYNPRAKYTLVCVMGVSNTSTNAEFRVTDFTNSAVYGTATTGTGGLNVVEASLNGLPTTATVLQCQIRSTNNVNNVYIRNAYIKVEM